MDTKSVWELLSEIPIGTIVAWIIVLVTIISAICAGTIKLYKLFTKYREIKDENKEVKETVKKHDEQFETIRQEMQLFNDKIDNVINTLNAQNEQSLIELRHSIVRASEEAILDGKISIRKYKALHEMFEQYSKPDANGKKHNGYCATIMEKVDLLPIVGRLDENDEDIDE